jgi:hypothetical protein
MNRWNVEQPTYYSDSLWAKFNLHNPAEDFFGADKNPYFESRKNLIDAEKDATRQKVSHAYSYTYFANCTANATGGLFVCLVIDVLLILFIPFSNFGNDDKSRKIWWGFMSLLFLADFYFLVQGVFWTMTAMKYLFFLKFPDQCIEETGKFYSMYLFKSGEEILNGKSCGNTGDLGAHGKIIQNLEFISLAFLFSFIYIGIATSVKNFYLLSKVRDDKVFNLKHWSTKRLITYIQNTKGEESLVFLKFYCPNLKSHSIVGKAIDSMTISRLMDIGIENVGHQIIVMKEFRELLARSEEPSWKMLEEETELCCINRDDIFEAPEDLEASQE